MIELKDILDKINNGVTDNNNKSLYISYINLIHNYFLDLEGIDFGIRNNILKQCNLIITRLIDHENGDLRDAWIKIRKLIIPDLIEKNEELDDDDKYFISAPNI